MNSYPHIFGNSPEQDIDLASNTPGRILIHITHEIENAKEYTYLIMGRFGPTGKTWLWDALTRQGYNAVEITEDVCEYVIYRHASKNTYYVNPRKKLVIITLNKLIDTYK